MPESCLSEEERALLPLMAWARPLLDVAENKVLALLDELARSHPQRLQAETLRSSVQAALLRPVIGWSQRTLILELGIARHYQQLDGDTPQARFADFVAWIGSAAGRKRLAQNYPTLQQDIRLRCQQSSQFVSGLLRQVVRDWPRLSQLCQAQSPGPLQSFTTQLGPHQNKGKSVTRLDFAGPDANTPASRFSLIYKPHSMALDQAYHDLLDWLAQQGIAPLQRAAAVLDCGAYGYMAQVRPQVCQNLDELTRYYERFGGLVALSHALGSVDFHHDNLIAAGEWPVLINLETLLQPAMVGPQQRHGPRPAFADTVLFSGLLPRGTPEGEHIDNTALFVPNEATVVRIPTNAGTDQMKLSMQRVAQPQCDNLPRLVAASSQDQAQPWHNREAICHGFSQTWRGLMRNKTALLAGPLAQFGKLPLRAIMRPAQVYPYALQALTHPNYLDTDDQRERLVARLRPVTVSGLAARRAQLRRTPILRCWPSERLALQRGDVPRFTARVDSRDAQDEQGEVLTDLFACSALEEAQSRIKQLSEANLPAQLRLLQQALQALRPDNASTSVSPANTTAAAPTTPMPAFDPAAAQAAALQIGEHILAQAMGSRGFACYYQLEARNHPALRPYPLRPELADGLAGLALFFAELAGSAIPPKQQARFAAEASRIVATVQRSYADFGLLPATCGAFTGLSGWIYTLARLSQTLQQAQWLALAGTWLEKLPPLIAQDRHFDVVQGCAGDLLVMLRLQQLAPASAAMAVAQACAAHLRQHAKCDGAGASWGDDASQSNNGFAHGGIVLALAQYAEISGERDYDDLISAALVWLCRQHDGSESDADADAAQPECGWQHGAAGRGLVLLNLPLRWHNAQTRATLEACLASTLTQKVGTAGFDVVDGHTGVLEFLQQVAQQAETADNVTSSNATSSNATGTSATGTTTTAAHWQTLAAQLLAQLSTQIPTHIPGHLPQPANGPDLLGYLHGWAGIGHGLLRMANPERIAALLTLDLR